MSTVSVAEIKAHLSEYIARSAHGGERIIITRRGRPLAALVGLDDLQGVERQEVRRGLAEIASSWPGFDELAAALEEVAEGRRQ